jgi:hypothetical protein
VSLIGSKINIAAVCATRGASSLHSSTWLSALRTTSHVVSEIGSSESGDARLRLPWRMPGSIARHVGAAKGDVSA